MKLRRDSEKFTQSRCINCAGDLLMSIAQEGSASEHWSSLHISDNLKIKSMCRVEEGTQGV
jgi:hypothetical protein